MQQQAEKRLLEQSYRLFIANEKDYAILMLDTDGRIISWNEGATQIKGYREHEVLGRHFSLFYPAEDVRNGKPAFELAEAVRTGRFEVEGWRVRKDGSLFFASLIITAFRDEDGNLQGFGKITRDISARKKAEEHLAETLAELRRSNEELEQFAAIASHDLQEPLRMVASYTQLLARRYTGRLDQDADEFIAYAVAGSTRLQKMIEDLLTYARVGSRAPAQRKASSDRALQEAIGNLSVGIDECGAIVTSDALPAIAVEPGELVTVFQNLIGNALKYRRTETPRIHISAKQGQSNDWIFTVQDNGVGIEAEYFQKIFVLFQRLHGGGGSEGTGIGLAVCKKTVERLGGRIWVESQPGVGSTFSFALPEEGRR